MQLRDQLDVTWVRIAAVLGLAAVGGAIGASLIWVATGQLGLSGALIGFVVTAIGWFISARLSEHAQKRLLLHNIINTSRIELANQIRREQEWCNRVGTMGFLYQAQLDDRRRYPTTPNRLPDHLFWLEESKKGHDKLHSLLSKEHTLGTLLEEYELLFPATTRVRHQLGYKFLQIYEKHQRWLHELYHSGQQEAVITAMKDEHDPRWTPKSHH